jgi:hypothetical protein
MTSRLSTRPLRIWRAVSSHMHTGNPARWTRTPLRQASRCMADYPIPPDNRPAVVGKAARQKVSNQCYYYYHYYYFVGICHILLIFC